MSRLILGIGTGRCGTTSLAHLLDKQPDCRVTHERFKFNVPWGPGGQEYLDKLISKLKNTDHEFYGDVALYWLPHVEELIWNDRVDVRVIALERERERTIQSFMRKTPNSNPWQAHNGDHQTSEWDHSFPKFRAENRAEAIGKYWDLYYGTIDHLVSKYPNHIKLYKTKHLNKVQMGQRNILNFVGIPDGEHVYNTAIRENSTTPVDEHAGLITKAKIKIKNLLH